MIRVAIIGAGIGEKHLAGFQELPDRFEVRTLCDLDQERAKKLIGEAPIHLESDFQAVLADPTIDLIDICLPPHLHFSAASDALNAGKHVVCEKPLVTSLKEADALIATAKAAGRMLSPVFQYRFGPAMAQLKALMSAGLAGKAYAASIETHWNRDAVYYAVPWRGTWSGENGGAVLGHAIHNHDLLTNLLGPIAHLSAMVTTRVNDIEVEDCAAISFAMHSGALATSSITLGAATDMTRIRICFDGLTAQSGTTPYAPMTDTWTFTARDPVTQYDVDAVLASVDDVKSGYAGFFEALADAIEHDGTEAVTPEDGRRSIELVTAIYQAAQSGQRINMPLEDDAPMYQGWAP